MIHHHVKRAHNFMKEVAWVIAIVIGLALLWEHFHEDSVNEHVMTFGDTFDPMPTVMLGGVGRGGVLTIHNSGTGTTAAISSHDLIGDRYFAADAPGFGTITQ